ncbi:phage head closure protein [Rhizobium sp. P32RR-XVIII]|uniref:phage head closure protein n=1 Tax=Rhizobium sp. P32RR-XVIII TaxID=2726738 RepID=UPI0014575C4B|nr:phage head closure protein [Rhizobium sp. P32RR-XVIII]NLS04616.1 phage head closure protein [Rhizobium sp. P32RR-XVIII]
MRAGKLDKAIVIEQRGEVVNDYGTVSEGWTKVASLRAQVLQQSTEEFLKSAGSTPETAVIFRIRWRADLTTEHRVTYRGQIFDLKEIKELGRRDGLELRCVAGG